MNHDTININSVKATRAKAAALFNRLDAIDQARIIERMECFLEGEKYRQQTRCAVIGSVLDINAGRDPDPERSTDKA